MEFIEVIDGEKFRFSHVAQNLFLVTGVNKEYILYKTKNWRCADEIEIPLLQTLGKLIDDHVQVSS